MEHDSELKVEKGQRVDGGAVTKARWIVAIEFEPIGIG